jgi:hypothetical protein
MDAAAIHWSGQFSFVVWDYEWQMVGGSDLQLCLSESAMVKHDHAGVRVQADLTKARFWDMSNNNLQDFHLQHITEVIDSSKRTFDNIKKIDLSYNRLTVKAVKTSVARLMEIFPCAIFSFYTNSCSSADIERQAPPGVLERLMYQPLKDEIERLTKAVATLTGQVKHVVDYKKVADEIVEMQVTSAVVEFLTEGIKVSDAYRFKSNNTVEVDGVVTGKLSDEEVIVFIQAKRNMDSKYSDAKQQMRRSIRVWLDLIEAYGQCGKEGLTLDELADFEALHIADHMHKRVVRALGREKFTVPAELSRAEQEHVYLFVRGDVAYTVTQH